MADLSVNIGKLNMSNPVMTASGNSDMDWSSVTSWTWRKSEVSS